MKKYNEEHEWVEVEGEIATVGISTYAVEQLGDITFIELPEIDAEVSMGDSVAFVESVKAASDIYTPISGEVCEVNEALLETPEVLNEDAMGNFVFKLKASNLDELDSLMDEEAYQSFVASL
ncbi:MAG TPA: glycine cleavage system protein GcvH [Campylobacterales bacterium]|nr:glycine cleavage system protein GcvH [Campylobacterales bacterium]HHS93223.1 glycine cleavage system protein GcvH [Campylobacterales bacterium]